MKERIKYLLDTIELREKEGGSYAECVGRLCAELNQFYLDIGLQESVISAFQPSLRSFRFKEGSQIG